MRIVITGGGGVLGQLVARALLESAATCSAPGATELILLDRGFPARSADGAREIRGDVCDAAVLEQAFGQGVDAVYHLAAVVSAGAEADFDLGMRVNLDGLRAVLDACRRQPSPPRLVFASSVAVFGGDLPALVDDTTAATPQSSYGTQKAIGELLVADMTRKGFIDGRSVRLPTVVVRPGAPNRAASGFMSSILREPLNGELAVCPVPPGTKMWILSPQRAVEALIHAMALDARAWGWDRTLNAPGLTVSVTEALAALRRIAGDDVADRVRFERDPAIERIVLGWPARFVTARADTLGFRADASIDDIIRIHRGQPPIKFPGM